MAVQLLGFLRHLASEYERWLVVAWICCAVCLLVWWLLFVWLAAGCTTHRITHMGVSALTLSLLHQV